MYASTLDFEVKKKGVVVLGMIFLRDCEPKSCIKWRVKEKKIPCNHLKLKTMFVLNVSHQKCLFYVNRGIRRGAIHSPWGLLQDVWAW